MIYLRYLKYILRHKWYVFVACCELGIPFAGLTHDLSKLRLSEFIPYARHFYGKGGDIRYGRDKTGYYKAGDTGDEAFDRAWLYHQHRNPHHWQYWLLVQDEDPNKALAMPSRYLDEMLADWRGAGKAQGTPDTMAWYLAHRTKMVLHPETRVALEIMLHVEIRDMWDFDTTKQVRA
jgi:hypothetical protein